MGIPFERLDNDNARKVPLHPKYHIDISMTRMLIWIPSTQSTTVPKLHIPFLRRDAHRATSTISTFQAFPAQVFREAFRQCKELIRMATCRWMFASIPAFFRSDTSEAPAIITWGMECLPCIVAVHMINTFLQLLQGCDLFNFTFRYLSAVAFQISLQGLLNTARVSWRGFSESMLSAAFFAPQTP